jgi:hypothetical protein
MNVCLAAARRLGAADAPVGGGSNADPVAQHHRGDGHDAHKESAGRRPRLTNRPPVSAASLPFGLEHWPQSPVAKLPRALRLP